MRRRKWKLWLVMDHRFFFEDSEWLSGIAVADNSGEFPEDTDDGLMWLDERSPITEDECRQWFIPLRRHGPDELFYNCDPRTKSPASWHEVVMVAMMRPDMKVIDNEGNELHISETLRKLKPRDAGEEY